MLDAAGDPTMSDPRQRPDASPATAVAQLLRDLAVRERQLRDLTEQSLGFLEELAESRRLNAEREQLVERLGDLERSLADAKSRLRHAGGAAPTAPTTSGKGAKAKARPAFEVVFWGVPPGDALASAKTAGVSITWVGLPDAFAADEATAGITAIAHRDARTPAQCWNLGMASTTADAVLFVGPGGRVDAKPASPDGLPANAALLCPCITRGESVSIGVEQVDEAMRLRPRSAADDRADAGFFRVQHADAAAFVVRRAAFERIGTFDEGLLGPAALLEYGLRARRANFDVLGVGSVTVTAAAGGLDEAGAVADRERMLVVAMHRPEQLGRALATTSLPWDLPAAEMPGFLAQLCARLPSSDDLAHQRAMLERITSGLAQYALPAADVVTRLQRARITLLQRFADAGTVAGREDFLAMARRVETERLGDPNSGFDAFAGEIAFCADVAAATARQLDATRTEMRAIDSERHSQSDRAARADGARQHAEQQLDQVQQWLLEARREITMLQETAVAGALEREALRQAKAELEARAAGAGELRQRLADLERLHEEESQRHWEFERQHLAVKAQYIELEREHLVTDADAREMREQITRAKELFGLPPSATTAVFAERLETVGAHWKRLAAVMQTTGVGDADELANRLAEAERLVRDRERWIARLLQEATQRRLFPRQLQDHEQALVERVGRSS